MKRITQVLLRVVWDDETDDHPAGWEWNTLIEGTPFDQGEATAEVVSFEDVDDDDRPIQV